MLSKILDEPYWQEMEEMGSYLSTLPKLGSLEWKGQEESITQFVACFIILIKNYPHVYHVDKLMPFVKEFVEKEGFDRIKAELIEMIKEAYVSLSLAAKIHRSKTEGEIKAFDQFFRETNNIQEIIETFHMYFDLLRESQND